MTNGYLWYNKDDKRYGVIDSADCWADEGLHCGHCMEIYVNDDWLQVRLEFNPSKPSHGWYLVGYPCDDLDMIKVRY